MMLSLEGDGKYMIRTEITRKFSRIMGFGHCKGIPTDEL
jgi:hypothetical protein